MVKNLRNYAFVDSQNLNLGVRSLGWRLDFSRFRVYLRDKYAIEKAFLFIGYIEGNTELYKSLQEAGFICIFKPALVLHEGKSIKGNCDAELVLHTMIEYKNFDKAVIVTGDGDFHCLVRYLLDENKLKAIIIPNMFRFSALFKFADLRPFLRFMNDLKTKLSYTKKEKTP